MEMNMNLKLLVSLVFFFSINLFAGREGGNGGDIVICDQGLVYQLLDYAEAKQLGYELDLEGANYQEKVYNAIDRLKDEFANLKTALKSYADELIEDIETYKHYQDQPLPQINEKLKYSLLTRGELTNIDDSNHKSIPENCSMPKQIIIHEEPKNFMKKRYEIKEDYLTRLNDDNLAGMIIHESLYRFSSTVLLHTDSVQTRTLNIYLSTSKYANHDFHQQLQSLIDFEFNLSKEQYAFKIDGFVIKEIKSLDVENKKIIAYLFDNYSFDKYKLIDMNTVYFSEGKLVAFDSWLWRLNRRLNGAVNKIKFVKTDRGFISMTDKPLGHISTYNLGEVITSPFDVQFDWILVSENGLIGSKIIEANTALGKLSHIDYNSNFSVKHIKAPYDIAFVKIHKSIKANRFNSNFCNGIPRNVYFITNELHFDSTGKAILENMEGKFRCISGKRDLGELGIINFKKDKQYIISLDHQAKPTSIKEL